MSALFNGASAFNGEISGWNVASVESGSMASVFRSATSLSNSTKRAIFEKWGDVLRAAYPE